MQEHPDKNIVYLAFLNPELEGSYLKSYFHKILPQVKVSLLLAVILYSTFTFLDAWIIPESKEQVFIVRFAIVIPLLILVFLFSYFSHFSNFWHWLMSLVGLVMGIGITSMVTNSNGLGSALYPTGIMLVVMWVYVFSGLRFIQGSVTCLLIMLSYSVVALNINVIPFPVYLNHVFFLSASLVIGAFAGYSLEAYSRADFINKRVIQSERLKSERLLLNVLPVSIAEELKRDSGTIAKSFDRITILFADIVGFTKFSASTSPKELVELLNQIFSLFDEIVDRLGLEKIKTIGDAYMAVAGVPSPVYQPEDAMARFAKMMLHVVGDVGERHGVDLEMRIGMASGPIMAGVVGKSKYSYDVWGAAVNLAARLENIGTPGCVVTTGDIKVVLHKDHKFERAGSVELKGFGKVAIWRMDCTMNASYMKTS